MKNILTFTFLFFLTSLSASNLIVEIHAAYCASAQSGQAIIEVSGGEGPYNFQWDAPDLEGAEVYDLAPGTYAFTVTDVTNCEVQEVFEILPDATVDYDILAVDPTCFGAADGTILIENFTPSDLQFSIDGVNFSSTPLFENLEDRAYEIFILESNNCMTQNTVVLNEPFELIVDLGPDIEVPFGDSVLLAPLVNISPATLDFYWTSIITLSCYNCMETWVKPFDSTLVSLIVEDANGCRASDDILISVGENPGVFIPNIFTPNEDGINDMFTVYPGFSVEQIKDFIVRDNFGCIVHHAADFAPFNFQLDGWDGRFEGKKMNPGVFIYQVTVIYVDGNEEEIFGTFTLMQ